MTGRPPVPEDPLLRPSLAVRPGVGTRMPRQDDRPAIERPVLPDRPPRRRAFISAAMPEDEPAPRAAAARPTAPPPPAGEAAPPRTVPRRSFSRRFLALILPGLLAMDLVAATGFGLLRYQDFAGDIRDTQAQTMPGIAAALAEPLWSFRYEQVELLLQGLMNDPDLLGAAVQEDAGHVIARIGDIDPSAPEGTTGAPMAAATATAMGADGESRVLRQAIVYRTPAQVVTAGSLVVRVGFGRARASAMTAAIGSFALALVTSLLVLIGVMVLHRRMLLRPMHRLLDAMARIGAGGGWQPVAWKSDDEIGVVVENFNAMQERLADEARTLQEAHEQLDRRYNGTPAMLHSVDAQGRLVGVSDHWINATGHARDVVLGRPLAGLLTASSARRYRDEILPRFLAQGSTAAVPLQLICADGGTIDVLLTETLDDAASQAARSRVSLSVMSDVTRMMSTERQLERSAMTDPLTGLLNRMGFTRAAGAVLTGGLAPHASASAASHGIQAGGATLMQIDFDRFKWINDTHGHAAGDEILALLAARLRQAGGEGAICARQSGDEFAILLPDGPGGILAAQAKVAEVHAVLRQRIVLQGIVVDLAVSAGTARYPTDGVTLDGLLNASDIAMLVAKRDGRDRLVAFGAGLAQEQARRQRLRRMVTSALDDGRFTIHVQPIVSLTAEGGIHRAAGAEVLARLNGPDGAAVLPSDFIVAAEESGQIITLGRQVLRQAIAAVPQLMRASGDPDFFLAINLSPGQVTDSLPAELERMITEHNVQPRNVCLEITETALFTEEQRAMETLRGLAGRGFRFALDDFGTGYSSVAYLTRFPVHEVKIDRGFTASLTAGGDRQRKAIIRAVVALGEELDLPIVAEGIESEEELAAAKAVGIGFGQGYLFARPQPVPALEAWLTRQAAALQALTSDATQDQG